MKHKIVISSIGIFSVKVGGDKDEFIFNNEEICIISDIRNFRELNSKQLEHAKVKVNSHTVLNRLVGNNRVKSHEPFFDGLVKREAIPTLLEELKEPFNVIGKIVTFAEFGLRHDACVGSSPSRPIDALLPSVVRSSFKLDQEHPNAVNLENWIEDFSNEYDVHFYSKSKILTILAQIDIVREYLIPEYDRLKEEFTAHKYGVEEHARLLTYVSILVSSSPVYCVFGNEDAYMRFVRALLFGDLESFLINN